MRPTCFSFHFCSFNGEKFQNGCSKRHVLLFYLCSVCTFYMLTFFSSLTNLRIHMLSYTFIKQFPIFLKQKELKWALNDSFSLLTTSWNHSPAWLLVLTSLFERFRFTLKCTFFCFSKLGAKKGAFQFERTQLLDEELIVLFCFCFTTSSCVQSARSKAKALEILSLFKKQNKLSVFGRS